MKTCICCGRTYPDDVRVCPACGVNLEQAPEKTMGPIEIEVEPEEWIPPHQQSSQTPSVQAPQAPQPFAERQPAPQAQRAVPEQAAPEVLSPELLRMFRRNQYVYIFRMMLLIVIALCLLVSLLQSFFGIYSSMTVSEFIGEALVAVAENELDSLRIVGRVRIPYFRAVSHKRNNCFVSALSHGFHKNTAGRLTTETGHINSICTADVIRIFFKKGKFILRIC